MTDVIAAFRDAMAEHGLRTSEEIIADGKLHRVHLDDDKPFQKTGWYTLHLDEPPSGSFGCWRTGLKETWTHKVQRKLSEREKKELGERIARDRAQRDEEEAQVKAEAAQRAKSIWQSARRADPGHTYLERKAIKPGPAREGNERRLVIPVVSPEKEVVSLQFISEDGSKRFLTGGRKLGCYCPIGKPESTILICEGFATGMSLHEATGYAVVVAFDAGNLKPVFEAISKRYPSAKILVCGDNDKKNPSNPGLKAAQEVGAPYVVPEFPVEHRDLSDFNDLWTLEGREAVRAAVDYALNPPPPPPPPPMQELAPQSPKGLEPGDVSVHNYAGLLPDQLPGKSPLGTMANLKEILDRMGAIYRYNVINKKQEIMIPGKSYTPDNYDNAIIADIIDVCARMRMPTEKVNIYLSSLCDRNQFNPVKTWIESKPWDTKSRLKDFFATVTAKDEHIPQIKDLKETLMRRWLVSAVAAAYTATGFSAHGVLVFQGPQYLGKTHWFKKLVPKELGLIKDGVTLNPDNKDTVLPVIRNWLVELGELDATFKKSDIAMLKAWITKDQDVIRIHYAARESEFPRRTVCFASVNNPEFLADPTGNRRFWTIECEKLDHGHDIDMQQLWAEVKWLYEQGDSPYLTIDELNQLNESNRKHEMRSPIEEIIAQKYDWDSPTTLWREASSAEILQEIEFRTPSQRDKIDAAKALRTLNGGLIRHDRRRGTVYKVPPKERPHGYQASWGTLTGK